MQITAPIEESPTPHGPTDDDVVHPLATPTQAGVWPPDDPLHGDDEPLREGWTYRAARAEERAGFPRFEVSLEVAIPQHGIGVRERHPYAGGVAERWLCCQVSTVAQALDLWRQLPGLWADPTIGIAETLPVLEAASRRHAWWALGQLLRGLLLVESRKDAWRYVRVLPRVLWRFVAP